MPIHSNIDIYHLEEQLDLLKRAGKRVTFVLPEIIKHRPGEMFGVVTTYVIVFEDAA